MEERREHPGDDLLQAWAEGGLAGGEAACVARHLEACPACTRHADAYRALFADLASVPPTPPDLQASVLGAIRGETAAAVPYSAAELRKFWEVVGLSAAAAVLFVVLTALDLPGRAWAAFPGFFAGADRAFPALAGLFERSGDALAGAWGSVDAALASLGVAGRGWTLEGLGLDSALFFLLAAAAGFLNLVAIYRIRRSAAGSRGSRERTGV